MVQRSTRIVALFLLVCTAQQGSAASLDSTDYQLLSTALSELVIKPLTAHTEIPLKQVVIMAQTSTGIPPGAVGLTPMQDAEAQAIKKEAPELLKSLLKLNKESVALDLGRLQSSVTLTTFTDQQAKEIFEGKGAGHWEEFYRRFPNSQGVSVLSRVVYSSAKTQALLYIGTMTQMVAGEGQLVLFEKNGSEWRMKRHGIVWVS